jgi:dihydropteridine reductase
MTQQRFQSTSTEQALVWGGSGALGSAIVQKLTESKRFDVVVNVDYTPNPVADVNVCLSESRAWDTDTSFVLESLKKRGVTGINLSVCAAGGWAGGGIKSDELLTSMDLMIDQCLKSSLACAHIARSLQGKDHLLVLTGAMAAMQGTPGMIAYGMTKAAVAQLTQSLAAENETRVVLMLPQTIDTPSNRKFMSDADKSTWTPASEYANKIMDWYDNANELQGGNYIFQTENNATQVFELSDSSASPFRTECAVNID